LEIHLPGHLRTISEALTFDRTPEWSEALRRAFEPLEAISIDYGVMEKATEVRCVVSRFTWTDVGGWLALRDYLPQDSNHNCLRGRVVTRDAKENLVFCEDPSETVLLVGVENLVVVRAGGRTLIAHKDCTEKIKKLVESMEADHQDSK
ncbi:MAG: hypothetical protein ACLFVT_10245, partial [Syntrophobacteria bacterium]